MRCPACKIACMGMLGALPCMSQEWERMLLLKDKPCVLGLLLVLLVPNVAAFCSTSALKCLFHSSALLLYAALPSVVIFLIPIFLISVLLLLDCFYAKSVICLEQFLFTVLVLLSGFLLVDTPYLLD